MTTAKSPLHALERQAKKIASILKAAERGDKIDVVFARNLEAARLKPSFKMAIVMDDKLITLELPWVTIREETEAGLSDFIVDQMRKAPAHD